MLRWAFSLMAAWYNEYSELDFCDILTDKQKISGKRARREAREKLQFLGKREYRNVANFKLNLEFLDVIFDPFQFRSFERIDHIFQMAAQQLQFSLPASQIAIVSAYSWPTWWQLQSNERWCAGSCSGESKRIWNTGGCTELDIYKSALYPG